MASKELRGMEFAADKSLSGICLRHGKPMMIHDLEEAQQRDEYFAAVEGLERYNRKLWMDDESGVSLWCLEW